jgi:hypothetical protein
MRFFLLLPLVFVACNHYPDNRAKIEAMIPDRSKIVQPSAEDSRPLPPSEDHRYQPQYRNFDYDRYGYKSDDGYYYGYYDDRGYFYNNVYYHYNDDFTYQDRRVRSGYFDPHRHHRRACEQYDDNDWNQRHCNYPRVRPKFRVYHPQD